MAIHTTFSEKIKASLSIFILVDFARFFGYNKALYSLLFHMFARSYRYVQYIKIVLLAVSAAML